MSNIKKIIGVCGWKNNGKTTLITSVLPLFIKNSISVGVIKHTHHTVSLDKKGKDSYLYREHGASTSVIMTDKGWAMTRFCEDSPKPYDILHKIEEEFIIIEGFKMLPHPKIEVYSLENNNPLGALEWPNIVAIASDRPLDNIPSGILWYDRNDPDSIFSFMIQHARKISL